MKGEELFTELAVKTLKKLDKTEIKSTIELNLQEIVNWYFNEGFKKEERKYLPKLHDLVLSKKLFIKPVIKLAKEDPEFIPTGLPYMVFEIKKHAGYQVNDAIKVIRESQISKEEMEMKIKEVTDEYTDICTAVNELYSVICKKNIKKLDKLGVPEEYATLIAPVIFDTEIVNKKNIFRIVNNMTSTMYSVYQSSIDDEGNTVMKIDLGNPKSMNKVLQLITKSMDMSTYASFIMALLLEKRTSAFDKMTQAQRRVYNAITTYALAVLEDKDIFSGKTRVAIIREMAEIRKNDAKMGRDAIRRIPLSELAEDMYPHICKAFNKVVKKNKPATNDDED